VTSSACVPFAHYSGSRTPRLLLLGEAWGATEDHFRVPFVGHSGKELFRMLCDAEVGSEGHEEVKRVLFAGDELFLLKREEWLRRHSIGMTNVFNLRPNGNKLDALCGPEGKGVKFRGRTLPPLVRSPKHLYMLSEFLPHLERLQEEIAQARPNLILALGAAALWGLGGAGGGHSDVRGTVLPGPPKILPTYHPAWILRQWSARTVTVADFVKGWRESATAEFVRPERHVLINPELEDIAKWITSCRLNPPTVLSCDIETKGGQITSIGFGTARDQGLVVPFVAVGETTFRSYWINASDEVAARRYARELLATPWPKLFQNGLYDIQWLIRDGYRIVNAVEDTMLLHFVIHPEMRKALGFLGSLYTNEPAWKLMRDRGKDEGEKAEE